MNTTAFADDSECVEDMLGQDTESRTRDAFFALLDQHMWPCLYSFAAGSLFAFAAAWVWSWFL